FAVHTHFGIALFAYLLEEFAVVSFSSLDHWCQYMDGFLLEVFEYPVDDLVFGHTLHLLARHIGKSFTCPGVEQTKKIIDFGDSADSRTGIFACCFLFDGDDGTESGNLVYIGPFQST